MGKHENHRFIRRIFLLELGIMSPESPSFLSKERGQNDHVEGSS